MLLENLGVQVPPNFVCNSAPKNSETTFADDEADVRNESNYEDQDAAFLDGVLDDVSFIPDLLKEHDVLSRGSEHSKGLREEHSENWLATS